MDIKTGFNNVKNEIKKQPASTKINAAATVLEVIAMAFWCVESFNGNKKEA